MSSLLAKRKRRYLNNNSEFNTLKFKESNEFDEFYKILLASKEKFKTTPTHSLEELDRLKKIFSGDIKLLLIALLQKPIIVITNNK